MNNFLLVSIHPVLLEQEAAVQVKSAQPCRKDTWVICRQVRSPLRGSATPALKTRERYLHGPINIKDGNGLWRQTAGVGVLAPPLNVRVILCTSFNLCDPLSLRLCKGDSFHRVVMRIKWRFVDQLHSAWYRVSAMCMFDKENKTGRKVRRAGETESAPPPRKLQPRRFWIKDGFCRPRFTSSLPLTLSSPAARWLQETSPGMWNKIVV